MGNDELRMYAPNLQESPNDVVIDRHALLNRGRGHLPRGVLLIAAPAGYGKTVLLRMLAREIPHSILLPLSLADRDPAFLEERLDGLRKGKHIILLDDVHLLDGATEALDWLAKAIQTRIWGWVLSGRWIPLQLRSALPSERVMRFTVSDLAFSLDEVRVWLAPRGYDEEALSAWHRATQGWPLAIAALALLSRRYTAPAEVKSGLEDFLETKVFARLWQEFAPHVRCFLSLTGVALEVAPELMGFLWSRFAPRGYPPVEDVWQEVVNRHLFLEPGLRPNTWRYHALFRRFLRRQAKEPQKVAQAVVQWYREQGWYDDAVEQALMDGLWSEAVDLLLHHIYPLIYQGNRIETYRRWVLSLPRSVIEAHPLLLLRLGERLSAFQRPEEGRVFVNEGMALVAARKYTALLPQAYDLLSKFFWNKDDLGTALSYARQLLQLVVSDEERRDAYRLLADIYLSAEEIVSARRFYRAALRLVDTEAEPFLAAHIWDSLAAGVLVPMGFIPQAEALLHYRALQVPNLPTLRHFYAQLWAVLYTEVGDWPRAREELEAMERASRDLEELDLAADFWHHLLWAFYHVGVGDGEAAEKSLQHIETLRSDKVRVYVPMLRAWLARRGGRPKEALHIAEEALKQAPPYPFSRGLLALERDIAATAALETPPPLHPDIRHLIRLRAVPSLLRLRGLLVWRCYRAGKVDEARRHLRRIRAVLRRFPRLKPVLVSRDPELARQVWRVALEVGEAEDLAVEALAAQSTPGAVADLLASPEERVQCLAAQVLAATRREEAMPLLHRALRRDLPSQGRRCVREALSALMALPPPPLEVQFLGAFRVRRGGRVIPKDKWPRPAVMRLFQYLVLHRGRPLCRDRIMEDLWPNQDPNRARRTLRRLLSWLHQTLEPYMPPKGPFRYLKTFQEIYTFDPDGRVTVDADRLVQVVEETLAVADEARVPPLPEGFLQALRAWATPVAAAPYDSWWLERVEEWRRAYTRGCVYAAYAYLARGSYQKAMEWAERALEEEPWLERAHQVKMQALARAGYRTRALAAYEEARRILCRELGVEPSQQTQWLAERLRRGEEI